MSVDHGDRPWGSYTVLEDAPHHKVKRIEVLPGMRLSYQRHRRRAEHWFVVAGNAATLDGVIHHLVKGSAIDIPVEQHTVSPTPVTSLSDSSRFNQHGGYFGEDDIERLEDDYGRAS